MGCYRFGWAWRKHTLIVNCYNFPFFYLTKIVALASDPWASEMVVLFYTQPVFLQPLLSFSFLGSVCYVTYGAIFCKPGQIISLQLPRTSYARCDCDVPEIVDPLGTHRWHQSVPVKAGGRILLWGLPRVFPEKSVELGIAVFSCPPTPLLLFLGIKWGAQNWPCKRYMVTNCGSSLELEFH